MIRPGCGYAAPGARWLLKDLVQEQAHKEEDDAEEEH